MKLSGKALLRKPAPAGAVMATVGQPAVWSSMPGWGTAADLIPPELINARRLSLLRKWMAVGAVMLLGVCAGGYYLASRENSAAAADLASAQDRRLQLQQESRTYVGVIAIQNSIRLVQTQVGQIMRSDVDLVALMDHLQTSLPQTMTITQESVVTSRTGVLDAATMEDGGLDTSGLPRIGTVTLSGTGKTLSDLSDYIDRLRLVDGLVDVVPVSNTASAGGNPSTQYNLRIGLTNALLSHRFDPPVPGTK